MRAGATTWWADRVWRRVVLVGCGAVLVGCGGAPPPLPAASPARPNVVLITLDTTRADHLGCYGYPAGTSPHLDRLAGEGVLFEQAVVSATVTPPSHASIFTGLYPYTHGLRLFSPTAADRLPEEAVTLAEVLRGLGYQTAAFVSAFPAGRTFGLDQGFDLFDEGFQEVAKDIAVPQGAAYTGEPQRHAGATTEAVRRWLPAARRPFLLWVHYYDPHDADLLPPPEFLDRFPAPAGSTRDKLRACYDLEIRYLDQQLGRLLGALDRAGHSSNTVVVVVSDHGEGLGDHDWWTHGILYQEQLRAALIIKAPGLPAARRIDSLVRTIDLFPTILELVGVSPADAVPVEGRSLVSLLGRTGADAAPAEPRPGLVAYAESVNLMTYRPGGDIVEHKTDQFFCIVEDDWKYIQHRQRETDGELYDLAADPGELRNLYAARPDVVRRLRADLESRDYLPAPPPAAGGLSPADADRLRSLGYTR